jgi:hypothetical protein
MSMYRRDRTGFEKLEPEETAVRWNGRGLARFGAPARRHETVAIKRAAESGWPVSDAMKALCIGAVAEVLDDPTSGAREKVSAVQAVVGMTRINAAIDQAAGPGDDPTPTTIRVEYVDELPPSMT